MNSLSDQINSELDQRKVNNLINSSQILLEELLNAPIVMECSNCHLNQNAYNEQCQNCEREL